MMTDKRQCQSSNLRGGAGVRLSPDCHRYSIRLLESLTLFPVSAGGTKNWEKGVT